MALNREEGKKRKGSVGEQRTIKGKEKEENNGRRGVEQGSVKGVSG